MKTKQGDYTFCIKKEWNMKRISLVIETALMFFVISFNATDASTLIINEIMSSNNSTLKDRDGDYPDWIEIHNWGESSIDLTGYGLSDDEDEPMRWVFPELSIEPGGYIIVFASGKDKVVRTEIHTNFKIKSAGEPLFISSPEGEIIDSVNALEIPSDFSLGRDPDNVESWLFFQDPTPKLANTTQGYSAAAAPVIMSLDGGFYDSDITVALSCDTPGVSTRYTIDGFDPDETSTVYNAPLTVRVTTVVKARALAEGSLPGPVSANTYFIGTRHTLPVFSLSSQHIEKIYTTYIRFDPEVPEEPVNIEFYEPDGTQGFSVVAGLRLMGNSLRFGQMPISFAIMARSRYGTDTIDYQLFPDLPITSFSSFLLRNPKYNFIIRDALGSVLTKEIDLDIQAYRPAVLYLNGDYWGKIEIREKLNEDYLASHHDVDQDNVDILEYHAMERTKPTVVEGDTEHYNALINFISTNDLTSSENYAYVKTQIDVDNTIKYFVSQLYFCNEDWPFQNVKLWRPKTPEGTWRWMVYDIDVGFWTFDRDIISELLDPNEGSITPPYSTVIFRNLINNKQFKYDFINLFCDYNATIFATDTVLHTINDIQSDFESEMPAHIEHWVSQRQAAAKLSRLPIEHLDSVDEWYDNIAIIKDFVMKRPDSLCEDIIDNFNLSGTAVISLSVNPPDAGKITFNTLTLDEFPWMNTYFKDVPIPLSALPKPGYRFTGWNGIDNANTPTTSIILSDDVTITANFQADSEALNTIVINEINYNSQSDFDPGDWVELHSLYGVPVDLSGWVFKDDDDVHGYIFPTDTIIEPNGYLVLCRDETLFHGLFPDVETLPDGFGFGLNDGGEHIRLYDSQGTLIDSLTYDDTLLWPEEPDRNGPTLVLRSPELDNALPESWLASSGNGTPGSENDSFSMIHEMDVPKTVSLDQNYPNPFNISTTIKFSLPHHSRIELVIYNVMGQKVRALIAEEMHAGSHSIVWNGRDDSGAEVSSGLYFALLTMGESTVAKGMLLVK